MEEEVLLEKRLLAQVGKVAHGEIDLPRFQTSLDLRRAVTAAASKRLPASATCPPGRSR